MTKPEACTLAIEEMHLYLNTEEYSYEDAFWYLKHVIKLAAMGEFSPRDNDE